MAVGLFLFIFEGDVGTQSIKGSTGYLMQGTSDAVFLSGWKGAMFLESRSIDKGWRIRLG